MSIRMFTQAEIIAALRGRAPRWLCAMIDGVTWFCDGRLCVRAEGETLGRGIIPACDAKRWEAAMSKMAAVTPEHYVMASQGSLFGEFGTGYARAFYGPYAPSKLLICGGLGNCVATTYLDERYFRAVERSAPAPRAWIHCTDPKSPLYFVADGKVVAIVMPLKCDYPYLRYEELPEVPFLEDAVLYHSHPVEERP